jgi:two-component system nitrate/nitrite response regulator NarL
VHGPNELTLPAPAVSPADERSRNEAAHSVVVASDVRLYCEGLKLVFAADGRLRLARSADCADAAIAAIGGNDIGALLLDAALPDVRRVLRAVREHAPRLPIVMFGVPEHDEELLYCVEAGATAFVSRDVGSRELIETVLAALRGEAIISTRGAAQVLDRLVRRVRVAAQFTPDIELTPRERQIASLLDDGLSNKEIAQRLRICVATVKNHVHRILAKLHVRRRGQAASRLRSLLNQKV